MYIHLKNIFIYFLSHCGPIVFGDTRTGQIESRNDQEIIADNVEVLLCWENWTISMTFLCCLALLLMLNNKEMLRK